MKYSLIFTLLVFFLSFNFVYAEEIIPITQGSGLEKIKFDGKWTSELEWKPTGLYDLVTENGKIYLRTAHQNDFIYIMVDAVPDTKITKDDYAMICFDTNNDKSEYPDNNDFCFSTLLSDDSRTTFTGDGKEFVKIKNHVDFIAIGTESDHNDRYSKIPHASYEFKIPLDLIGRSDTYGFYFMINDHENSEYYWPSIIDSNPKNTPSKWGILVSPDKSLPEFSFVYVILVLSLFFLIITTKNLKKFSINQ